MGDDAVVFNLEEDGRLTTAERFATFLVDHEGQPVKLDACGASLMTSLHLQLHIAAERDWAAKGVPYELINASDQLTESLALMGWRPDS